MTIEYVSTICPYCSCGCGIYLVVKDSKTIGQEPWKEHPINEGTNCPKGMDVSELPPLRTITDQELSLSGVEVNF